MKPSDIKTKVFLDSGDPEDTKKVINTLGFLDGQTTNPSLVAKDSEVLEKIDRGEKFTKEELYKEYKKLVQEISELIPEGSVSIEVYSDNLTTADEMLHQGREMFTWIPNAHIKFPTTYEGLKAAEKASKEGMRINMTLVFSQLQAAAVYVATKGLSKGNVFISPFIGRLDDQGENGIDLISNIQKMYKEGDNHVEVLAASIRTLDHLYNCLFLNADIVTVPAKILYEWKEHDFYIPTEITKTELLPIPFQNIPLTKNWDEYDINHSLTTKGIEKFVADWKKLIYE